MHIAIAILILQCTLGITIKVPVIWDNDSEVKPVTQDKHNEYFHYTANKPQFAVEVAHFHDVKSPEKHYESYPINPYTGLKKTQFGKHEILNSVHQNYKPYQEYVKKGIGIIKPVSNYYEVYHPYQAEIPALQSIYRDPILSKIRNDVLDSKNRLQQYENDAGEADIQKDEYLEHPNTIDKKKVPHYNYNVPATYEIHKPLRRPIYYQRIPISNNREHFLHQKLRHPLNQNYAKVTPVHYRPLKHHLHQLRQQHSLTYDDEKNEYPQIISPQQYAEKPEGYDIFEKGEDKYKQIRNGFDEAVNKAILENQPVTNDNLELQKQDYKSNTEDDESEDFIPIKNYAQVRKTATFKHLPKSAAFQDAENFEEIQNAPRLREAIKSSKNQVVYSEEGYEDSAYDHAGEHKHASDHERHGGFLTEDEASRGKYKIPTIDIDFTDKDKSSSGDQISHGEKFKDERTEDLDENNSEDYAETENDYTDKSDVHENDGEKIDYRHKRNGNETHLKNEKNLDHGVYKREAISNASSANKIRNTTDNVKLDTSVENHINKYPYYFKNSKVLHINSPLRYSENLNLIPKKTTDDSAFYNSRLGLKCPEVEREVNPVPDKFKNGEVSQDSKVEDYDDNEKGEVEFKNFKNKQRLRGLGDKIDCLKMKYFGKEPLDSPFFSEDLIKDPPPLLQINSSVFSTDKNSVSNQRESNENNNLKSDTNKLLNNIYYNNNSSTVSVPSLLINNTNLNQNNQNSSLIRKKRGVTFMYEPYKVIKENQISDSKKLTTSSNISPLIRKLQTRQIIDNTSGNNQRYYKDIGKNDRPFNLNEQDIVDISTDQRRGEPRYEIDLKNHRSQYSPVENKTSMSLEDYRAKTGIKNDTNKHVFQTTANKQQKNVTKYHPRTITTQSIAASNIVSKMIQSTTKKPQNEETEDFDEDEDYEEYEDETDEIHDEKEFIATTTSTSSTTNKPSVKKRIHLAPTTKTVAQTPNSTKLQLITRFQTTTTDTSPTDKKQPEYIEEIVETPRYREKKRKTTKSTLVTDSESYGDDIDDMREEEIDSMIGVKQDMDEYTPSYEKENKRSEIIKNRNKNNYHEKIDDQKQEDDDDDDDEDESEEIDDDAHDDDYDEDEDDDETAGKIERAQHKNKEESSESRQKIEMTTSEPTKRTLIKTTEPTSTTEVLHENLKPIVFHKKIEIHKDLPVNKSSPHVTRFKEDIKEIEIIKELDNPRLKKTSNSGSLNLYKDENLAQEINNLGDIEVFNDAINLERGPKHGGNYRSITSKDLEHENTGTDVETSQTEAKKIIEHKTSATRRPKLRSDIIRSRNQKYRNMEQNKPEKYVNASKTSRRPQNTNLRKSRNRSTSDRSAKLIELQDDELSNGDVDNFNGYGENSKAYNSKSYNKPMHGGNYRSEKLTDNQEITTEKSSTRRNRNKETEVLSAYVKAVPEITTSPAFILDPSKRMYYYLEK